MQTEVILPLISSHYINLNNSSTLALTQPILTIKYTNTHTQPLDKPEPPRNPTEKMLMIGKVVRRDP